jgi:hypothetical protein
MIVQPKPRAIGVGGYPVAYPYYGPGGCECIGGGGAAEDEIRHRPHFCCCDYPTGPDVPPHWYEGGKGWVGKYFTDVEPFDWKTQKNGRFRCQISGGGRPCNHEIQNDGCCDGNCCWFPKSTAVYQMIQHVASHGIFPPARTGKWATELCDTEGCCDVICCPACQGSRQMMALGGYRNQSNCWWIAYFCCMSCSSDQDDDGDSSCSYIPPWIYIACLTRFDVVELQNIDEGCCKSLAIAACCSPCSMAQTYRELSAANMWPGGCCNSAPPKCASLVPPKQQAMGPVPQPGFQQQQGYGNPQPQPGFGQPQQVYQQPHPGYAQPQPGYGQQQQQGYGQQQQVYQQPHPGYAQPQPGYGQQQQVYQQPQPQQGYR